MKSKFYSKIIFSVLLLIFVIFAYIKYLNYSGEKTSNTSRLYSTACGFYDKGVVRIGEHNISVDIADDICKKTLGLSGGKSLEDNSGMFFVSNESGYYGFWMKDMNFPLDIIWIDENFNIVGIEKNISPETYPKIFGDNLLAKYVLEIPAGYSDKNQIKIGDSVSFSM